MIQKYNTFCIKLIFFIIRVYEKNQASTSGLNSKGRVTVSKGMVIRPIWVMKNLDDK